MVVVSKLMFPERRRQIGDITLSLLSAAEFAELTISQIVLTTI
jgi:hypothetical protein